MAKFDAKSFNPQAFAYMAEHVPTLKLNELKKSRALAAHPEMKAAFSAQGGAAYGQLAMRGVPGGEAVNYDGQMDISVDTTGSYEQGVVVVGRAKAWMEKDFAYDITGGENFMKGIAEQVAEYMDGVDQKTLLSILSGIFSMSGEENEKFIEAHTTDVSGVGDGKMTATTLNSACTKACGANRKKFSLVIMHSQVAENLENLQLLEYMKYTDAEGITRDMGMATWNGRYVLVDDDMPVGVDGKYTTYVLGNGAIAYENVGVKVPYEIYRDPKTNGGEDTLYIRQRKCFAPYGISYEKVNQASASPTDAELADGNNWSLVHSGEDEESERSYFDHKLIPIARIISKG